MRRLVSFLFLFSMIILGIVFTAQTSQARDINRCESFTKTWTWNGTEYHGAWTGEYPLYVCTECHQGWDTAPTTHNHDVLTHYQCTSTSSIYGSSCTEKVPITQYGQAHYRSHTIPCDYDGELIYEQVSRGGATGYYYWNYTCPKCHNVVWRYSVDYFSPTPQYAGPDHPELGHRDITENYVCGYYTDPYYTPTACTGSVIPTLRVVTIHHDYYTDTGTFVGRDLDNTQYSIQYADNPTHYPVRTGTGALNPEVYGYTFCGWVNPNGVTVSGDTAYVGTEPDTDVEITAQYKRNSRILRIDGGHGVVNGVGVLTKPVWIGQAYGTKAVLTDLTTTTDSIPTPVRKGYSFVEYQNTNGETVTDSTVMR